MTLPASGPLSLSNVNTEIGVAANALISMNDSIVRGMAGKSSGAISISNLYGKNKGWAGTLTISANTQNYNIRTAALAAGWDGTLPATITVVVNAGVYVGASSTGNFGITTGTFTTGSSINIINNGFIVGCGGGGGTADGYSGGGGGSAINMNFPLTITNNGYVLGGGGGGGGGGSDSYQSGENPYYIYGCGGGGGAGYSGGGGGGGSPFGGPAGGAGGVGANGSGGGGAGGVRGGYLSGGNGGAWGAAGGNGAAPNQGYGAGPGNSVRKNGFVLTWAGTNGAGAAYVKGTIV